MNSTRPAEYKTHTMISQSVMYQTFLLFIITQDWDGMPIVLSDSKQDCTKPSILISTKLGDRVYSCAKEDLNKFSFH